MPRRARAPLALTLALAAAPAVGAGAGAQLPAPAPVRPLGPGTRTGEPRFQAGASFTAAQPVREFRQSVRNTGLGGAGHALYRLGASGAFAVRADLGFFQYGRERRRVPVIPGIGRVTADLVTTNNVFTLGVGPQLMVPTGPVRPYAHGSVGLASFTTTSSLQDNANDGDDDVVFRDRNLSSTTLAGGGGAGVLIPVSRARRSIAFIDLGARYHHNGRARYLTRGGITDRPDGSVALDVREGPANFWTYQIGLSFGTR